jgi:hypothetical protein
MPPELSSFVGSLQSSGDFVTVDQIIAECDRGRFCGTFLIE